MNPDQTGSIIFAIKARSENQQKRATDNKSRDQQRVYP